jgi:microcystin-dependent protein
VAQGFLIPLPQVLWDNVLHEPANGWKLYYTHAGLGTPVTTYSDATLLSANTNPVITSAGTWRAFVAEAVIVDIEVKNAAGVSQFTVLSVEAMPDTAGNSPSVTAVPSGGILAWSTSSAPTGFLLCNGAAVNRSTYSTLNTLLSAAGYPFGNGDGVTTFNVPDLRGRFPLGVAASGTGSTLGGTFGSIDHTHTGPSHTHVVTVPRDGWGEVLNTPAASGRINTGYASGAGEFASAYQATADQAVTSAAGGTGNTGTANPPAIALWFIIKT